MDRQTLQRPDEITDDKPTHSKAKAAVESDAALGKDGDVVTVVGDVGFLGVVTVIAALPEAGQPALLRIREDGGARDDPRLVGSLDRDLDHVDPEERGAVVTYGPGRYYLIARIQKPLA